MSPDADVRKSGGGRLKPPAVLAALCLHGAMATPLLMAADSPPAEEPVTIEFILLQAPPQAQIAAVAVEVPLPAPQPEAALPEELKAPEPALAVEPEPLPDKAPPSPKPKPKPAARPQPPPAMTAAAPSSATEAAPAMAVPPTPRPGGVEPDTYLAMLLRHLQAFRDYPAAARRRGQEGRVVVLVALQPDGSVASAVIENGSGYDLLDQAALNMVGRASPFPPPPPQAPRRLRFPIDFSLQR